jgi:hypothetical protein
MALGFALLALASVGLLVLPVALLAAAVAHRRTGGRGGYGVLVGAGAVWAGVCLPQGWLLAPGLVGAAAMAAGVVLCLARAPR